jgi:hypothetical protein
MRNASPRERVPEDRMVKKTEPVKPQTRLGLKRRPSQESYAGLIYLRQAVQSAEARLAVDQPKRRAMSLGATPLRESDK